MLLNENKDVEECLRSILLAEVLDVIDGISFMPKHVALLLRQFSMSMFSSFLFYDAFLSNEVLHKLDVKCSYTLLLTYVCSNFALLLIKLLLGHF